MSTREELESSLRASWRFDDLDALAFPRGSLFTHRSIHGGEDPARADGKV
jgi:hypothetical protein